MKTCSVMFLLGALAFLAQTLPAETASKYLFFNFEKSAGWHPGSLSQRHSSLTTVQGDARISQVGNGGVDQVLEFPSADPFSAVLVDVAPLVNRSLVYCEVLVRPVALGENRSDEFLDFGGAVLGFFKNDQHGEICALYSKSSDESVWISSGMPVALSADGVGPWLRLTIRLNQKIGRWDLAINGRAVLAGLRTVPRPPSLRLWLYGDQGHAVQFDDLLVANRSPDELEEDFERKGGETSRSIAPIRQTGRQMVIREKSNAALRQASSSLRQAQGKVRLSDWHISMESGGHIYEAPKPDAGGLRIMAYSPAYDDEGKVLPTTLTLTADAELEPGADLSNIRWEVRELLGLDKYGVVVAKGDFHTGLVQTVTVSAEWSLKATAVFVENIEK